MQMQPYVFESDSWLAIILMTLDFQGNLILKKHKAKPERQDHDILFEYPKIISCLCSYRSYVPIHLSNLSNEEFSYYSKENGWLVVFLSTLLDKVDHSTYKKSTYFDPFSDFKHWNFIVNYVF